MEGFDYKYIFFLILPTYYRTLFQVLKLLPLAQNCPSQHGFGNFHIPGLIPGRRLRRYFNN
jgi:hypothetical protein